MRGPRSLELMMILSDLSMQGVARASGQLAQICVNAYGGSNRAYINLLRRLEKNGLVTLNTENSNGLVQWVPKLTAKGKSVSTTLSPIVAWETPWDGKWRMLTFDLPSHASSARFQLRDWLQALRFGKLQGSVWLSHRTLTEIESSFAELHLAPDAVVCIEGHFWSSGNSASYVETAWPLDRVQSAYSKYLSFLDSETGDDRTLKAYQNWRAREKSIWNAALKIDPLLPEALWPQKRLGSNLALEAEKRRKLTLKNWLESASFWQSPPDSSNRSDLEDNPSR